MRVHLVRHAKAGQRAAWEGDDRVRPLTKNGWRQAEAIADHLAARGASVLLTSPYLRCRQTLEPLGDRLGLPVEDRASLAEGGWGNDALDELLAAAAEGRTVAACSHGDVIPAIVATAVRRGAELVGPSAPKKGARYECEVAEGQISRIVAVPPPDREP